MANQQKINAVASIKQDLSSYDAYAFVSHENVAHQQLEKLRAELKKQDGKIKMVKNTLLLIALKEIGIDISDFELSGPTAMVLVRKNNLSPIKIIQDKGKELNTFKVKAGVWEGSLVGSDYMLKLANLPGIDQLLAQLIGQLKSPPSRLIFALKGNLQKLTIALDEIRKQKEETN